MTKYLLSIVILLIFLTNGYTQEEAEEKPFVLYSRVSVGIQPVFGKEPKVTGGYLNGIHAINGLELSQSTDIGIGIAWERSKLTHAIPVYLNLAQDITTFKGIDFEASLSYGYAIVRQVKFGEFSKFSFKPGSPTMSANLVAIPATGNSHNVFFGLGYRFSKHPIEKTLSGNSTSELVKENWHGLQIMIGYAFN
jgi:hypothetical protein